MPATSLRKYFPSRTYIIALPFDYLVDKQLQDLFVKVGSFHLKRENLRLTPEGTEKFTERLRADPQEFALGDRPVV